MSAPQQTPQEPPRIKNTDVAWFTRHARIGKRLERQTKKLEEQQKVSKP